MLFVCPKCGGDSIHHGPILYKSINGYKYCWTSLWLGIIPYGFMCWGKCPKCDHMFEVHLSRRDAKRLEKEMWKTDVSRGKVKHV